MLRFFRQIRQKLLTENRFSKYLLYAVGEILLVVIGILIALQVNNWNEARKLRQVEIDSLSEILTGLRETHKEVELALEQDRRYRECNYKILDYLDNRKPYDESLDNCFGVYYWSPTVQLTTSAYDQLKLRGLEIISNDSLRNDLTEMFDTRFDVLKSEVELWDSQLLLSTLYPLHTKHFRKYYPPTWQIYEDEFAKPVNYEGLLDNEQFKNVLSEIISLRNWSVKTNEMLDEEIPILIGKIEEELQALKGAK
jgi:hypothetical protein